MKFLFLLTLMVSQFGFAAGFTSGEGRFISEKGDSHNFIKKQLIHEGTKNVLSKELSSLGLNKDLFWQKYEEKLNNAFEKIKDKLAKQLNITEKSNAKEREQFEKKYREKKFEYRVTFGGLNRTVSKYSVKKISRSQKNSQHRNIRLEASIDTKILSKIYYQFTGGARGNSFGSLYINTEYTPVGVTFSELGVSSKEEFSSLTTNKWKEWFENNKPVNITSVDTFSKENSEILMNYNKNNSNEMLSNTPSEFANSLLIDIEVKIIKERVDLSKNEYQFSYIGLAYLKDLTTNSVLQTYKFEDADKQYTLTPNMSLANIILNQVYRMGISSFPQMSGAIKKVGQISNIQAITLKKFPTITDVMTLVDSIQERGVKYSAFAEIESIQGSQTDIRVFYNGQVSDLKTLLNGINSAKTNRKYQLIEEGGLLSIKFI